MRTWIQRVGIWLARKAGWRDETEQYRKDALRWRQIRPQPDVLAMAIRLTKQMETSADGTSGEYKRHQVYARMLDTFPEARKSHLGLAIELAVQSL